MVVLYEYVNFLTIRVCPVGICYKTPQNTRLSANRVWGKWLNCNNFTFVNCSNVRKSWEICTLNIISTFVKCSNDTFYWNLRWREKVMNNHVCKSYTWWYKHSNIMSTLSMLGFQRFLFLFFRRDLEFKWMKPQFSFSSRAKATHETNKLRD